MSFYIAAHIVFDKSELKSVDIVDENHVFTTDTLEKTMTNLNTDFYIKIMVEKYDRPSNDCFGLSNGTYYRLNFDQAVNGTLVNGDFLKMSNQTSGNQTSEQTLSKSNQTPHNKQNSIKEFNELIVKALSALSPEKSVTEENPVVTPVESEAKTLENNPQINDGKTYFIKSTKKPALSP